VSDDRSRAVAEYINGLEQKLKAARDERDRLRADVEEYDQLLTRLRDLLTGTANALKGEPGPLVLHDWSDLPKVATDVVAERDRRRAVVKVARELVDANDQWRKAVTTHGVAEDERHHRAAAMATLALLVRELDGSGVMGAGRQPDEA
jgi:hypothetical protein